MKSEDKINLKEEEVMCGCKETACEAMMCWNLKIGKIGWHCDKRELWILIDWQATSFTDSGVPANFWKMWNIRHLWM